MGKGVQRGYRKERYGEGGGSIGERGGRGWGRLSEEEGKNR